MSLIKIIIYSTSNGKEPYSEWEDGLDRKTHAIIKNRLDRLQLGNFGDIKPIKGADGVWEIRIDYGPGYRIYFGKQHMTIVLLLTGGEKKNQARDIAKAKRYWLEGKDLL
jgi:putative addiction module killer protein